MALIIGLEGKARHGKGAASDFFSKELSSKGYKVAHVSFSHIIHEDCAKIVSSEYNIPYETAFKWMTDEKFKDSFNDTLGSSPRKIMQDYGNNKRITCGDNYFVDIALSRIPDDVDVVINDSVRFDNEVERLRNIGGKIIKIFNPNVLISESNDLTERGITKKPDLTLENTYHNGSEDDGCDFESVCCDYISDHILHELEDVKLINEDCGSMGI